MLTRMNNNILYFFILIFIIIILYLLKYCKRENFTSKIYQPIKKLNNSSNNLIPYLEKIRTFKYPKINSYNDNNDKNDTKLVFNNTNNQNKRNTNLNKLNTKYFTLEDDVLNKSLLPKHNELFII